MAQRPADPDAQGGVTFAKVAVGAFAGCLVVGMLAAVPFLAVPWLPRRRFGALPWVPTSVAKIDALLQSLPASCVRRGARFVDLGSGDGVAVFAAAKRGMYATGIELNPTLVAMSQVAALRRAGEWRSCGGAVNFQLGDFWSAEGALDLPGMAGTHCCSTSLPSADARPLVVSDAPSAAASAGCCPPRAGGRCSAQQRTRSWHQPRAGWAPLYPLTPRTPPTPRPVGSGPI
jgi:SAM-dependent methyltransferase